MKNRIRKVRQVMEENNLEALLIDSAVNRFYLTGFTGTSGRVLFTPQKNYFITDFRYTQQAKEETDGYLVKEINKDVIEELTVLLKTENVNKLGIETKAVSLKKYNDYKEKIKDIELIPTEDLISKLRIIKEEKEIERIKTAVKIAEKAFDHILDFIKPGKTEREISLELEYFMKKNGGEGNAFSFIVASGKRSSMPHGVASDKKVEYGDFITMDYGTVFKGYNSDMTRTIVLGKADRKQKEIYNTVLKAQKEVIKKIKPGMTGKQTDTIARDIICEAGYSENFGHGLGHGLGIEVHEGPRVSYRSEEVLKEGMIVTDEPGIYIPDWGGVRIEDDLLITADGCEVLNKVSKELIEL